MDAQLKKGVLELCLLQCLSGEPQYGYDIIQMMHKYFPEVTESTFYAVLVSMRSRFFSVWLHVSIPLRNSSS